MRLTVWFHFSPNIGESNLFLRAEKRKESLELSSCSNPFDPDVLHLAISSSVKRTSIQARATVDISFPMSTITATFRCCSLVGPWLRVEDCKGTFWSILSKGCLVGAKSGGQRGDSSLWLWLRVGWTGDSMGFAEAAFWEAFPRGRLHVFYYSW